MYRCHQIHDIGTCYSETTSQGACFTRRLVSSAYTGQLTEIVRLLESMHKCLNVDSECALCRWSLPSMAWQLCCPPTTTSQIC